MKTHPAADLFPLIEGDEYDELVADIKAHGLIEPVWYTSDGFLLDGRNRVRACGDAGVRIDSRVYEGDDPIGFVMSLNLARRHLNPDQRALVALDVLELKEQEAKARQGTRTDLAHDNIGAPGPHPSERGPRARDEAAKTTGASGRSVARAKRIRKHDAEHGTDLEAQVRAGKKTLKAAETKIKRDATQHRRDTEAKQRETNIAAGLNIDLRHGDFRQVLDDLDDVDAIITDPPYPKKYLPLLADLATFAADTLNDDGILAVMIGQSYLPDVYRLLDGPLPYLWTIAYLTPGGQATQIFPRKVNTFWKPVLLYGQSPEWIGDVTRSEPNDNDKRHHQWGQSASGMIDLVGRITKPGAHIVDPFLGAGTTGIAAVANGCHFTGADIDAEHVQTCRERLTP